MTTKSGGRGCREGGADKQARRLNLADALRRVRQNSEPRVEGERPETRWLWPRESAPPESAKALVPTLLWTYVSRGIFVHGEPSLVRIQTSRGPRDPGPLRGSTLHEWLGSVTERVAKGRRGTTRRFYLSRTAMMSSHDGKGTRSACLGFNVHAPRWLLTNCPRYPPPFSPTRRSLLCTKPLADLCASCFRADHCTLLIVMPCLLM